MVDRRKTASCVLLCSIVALGAGCGKSGPALETVDVAGTVLLDGIPLADVTVMFVGGKADFVGMGKTGPDGKYRLDHGSIPGMKGAMPGKNEVYFTKAAEAKEPSLTPSSPDLPTAEAKDSRIPPKYTDPAKPVLSFDVPEAGTQSADFQLSSK